MDKLSLLLLLAAVQLSIQDGKWWESTIVYQIYPRSFQDCSEEIDICRDGIGDLKGITSKLDHLVNLGVETFWLSPIYKSPMADFGYDISDYEDIDKTFGTMKDFETLAAESKKRNLSIVMDFVPNHSSNEHPWFLLSENRTSGYEDMYIWRNGTKQANGTMGPPNNWLSVFRNSAWNYSDIRKQYYYHAFTPEQPDLNYRNPRVVEEWKNILQFWLDKGVSGFRMDAVPFLFEDDQFRDEPKSNKTDDPNDYGYLQHIYTFNLPETKEVLKTLTDYVHNVSNGEAFVMVEALNPDLSIQDMMEFYNCSDFPFNFNLIVQLSSSDFTASALSTQISDWLDNIPVGRTPNWVLGNHDNWRIGTRFGEDTIDGFNMVSLLLPGIAVTYYGEEIGMLNTNITFDQTVDPQGINCGKEHYMDEFCSRDFERTPMQWNNEKNAGFSEAQNTWLPVNENYLTGITVSNQTGEGNSHYNIYRQLANIRKTQEFKTGGIKMKTGGNDRIFAFSRFSPQKAYIVVFNVKDGQAGSRIDLLDLLEDQFFDQGKVIIRSINVDNPETEVGKTVDLFNLLVQPKEAIVLEVTLGERSHSIGFRLSSACFTLTALLLLLLK